MKPETIPVDFARENRRSIAAAVALSVLTLATFAAAAGRGPESAVKSFHEAVKDGNMSALDSVIVGKPDGPDQATLIGHVRQLLSRDTHIELGKVQSFGPEATVDVIYMVDSGQVVRFVLVQSEGRWQVDAKRTLDLLRRPLGF